MNNNGIIIIPVTEDTLLYYLSVEYLEYLFIYLFFYK